MTLSYRLVVAVLSPHVFRHHAPGGRGVDPLDARPRSAALPEDGRVAGRPHHGKRAVGDPPPFRSPDEVVLVAAGDDVMLSTSPSLTCWAWK